MENPTERKVLPGGISGSAGRAQTRTFFTIPFIMGAAPPNHKLGMFVVDPIPYPSTIIDDLMAVTERACRPQEKAVHPIHTAIAWNNMLSADNALTMADIARKQGISRARVTQVMSLLKLPDSIQQHLKLTDDYREIQLLTERKMRQILALKDEHSQIQAFENICRGLAR